MRIRRRRSSGKSYLGDGEGEKQNGGPREGLEVIGKGNPDDETPGDGGDHPDGGREDESGIERPMAMSWWLFVVNMAGRSRRNTHWIKK